MIEGTLDRNSKRGMVSVATFVSFVLLASMVVVVEAAGEAAGTEDNASPRSSVLTTVVEEGPVPVPALPTRKLTKNSKASKDDAAVSEELEGLLRLLVYETALDLYRSREPSSVDATVKEACTDCVDFFTWGTPLPRKEQLDFCTEVVDQVLVKLGWDRRFFMSLHINRKTCYTLLECSSTATICCQSQGLCRN